MRISCLPKPQSLPRLGVEGYKDGRWVCLDYSELVVHIFDRDSRLFYDFDHLWADAPEVEVELGAGADAGDTESDDE